MLGVSDRKAGLKVVQGESQMSELAISVANAGKNFCGCGILMLSHIHKVMFVLSFFSDFFYVKTRL